MRGERAAAASTARSERAANCALAGEEVDHGADGNGWAIARREVQQQTVRADPGLDIRNAGAATGADAAHEVSEEEVATG